MREALHASTGGETAAPEQVLGVLSLIFWALTVIVTVKYIAFVLRADNQGEGGTLSLMALARGSFRNRPAWILIIGILGASLFFGDAVITPAISVLSAVEGMKVVTPTFEPYVVPLTLLILAIVFSVQRFGTGKVAAVFGPITLLWFVAIGISGLIHIADAPSVLAAINPLHIGYFLIHSPGTSFVTIGAVFLAVTGAEALYADLGHFGRKPIVHAWLWIVFPSLLLNYFGQGAFVLRNNGTIGHPFFEMNEGWMLIPMVVLATAATVIASQAVISGAFSLARQAVQLNMLPRFEVQHTSETQSGQIYMPRVNMLLALSVMLLVVGFKEFERPRFGVWHFRHRQHADDHGPAVRRDAPPVEMAACDRRSGNSGVRLDRRRLLRLQHRQGLRRRLGLGPRRSGHRAYHGNLGEGFALPV